MELNWMTAAALATRAQGEIVKVMHWALTSTCTHTLCDANLAAGLAAIGVRDSNRYIAIVKYSQYISSWSAVVHT